MVDELVAFECPDVEEATEPRDPVRTGGWKIQRK